MSERVEELVLRQLRYMHEMLRALAQRDAAETEEEYRALDDAARAFKTACGSIGVELFDLRPARDADNLRRELEARLDDIGNRCWTHMYQFFNRPNGAEACLLEADTLDGQHFVAVNDSLLGACRQMSASLWKAPSATEGERNGGLKIVNATTNADSVDGIFSELHGRGWSFGFAAVRREDGSVVQQVDASRDGHRYVVQAPTLAEACGELRRRVPGADPRSSGSSGR